MQAAIIDRYGDNRVVRIADVPAPTAGDHDVTIAVHAASVNPVDWKIRAGQLKVLGKLSFPAGLGNDLSGVVTAIGSGVTRVGIGDPVFARIGKDRTGAFAEIAVVHEDHVAIKPPSMSHGEAAALALAGLTAWQGLTDVCHLQAGERVLIHAGTGGVGTLAIQLAKSLGATVIATAGPSGMELVKQLGADVVIDYRSQRFEAVVRDIDVVFDTIGAETRARSFAVCKPGARMVSISGLPTAAFARQQGLGFPVRAALAMGGLGTTWRAWRRKVDFTYLFMKPSGSQLTELAAKVVAGTLRVIIDRRFDLAHAADALAYVETGRAKGKVVIDIVR
jgi:NADPH:quinone reductase-like Zn-dependent oxidoreductase